MKAKSLLWSMAMLAVMLFATLPAQSQDRLSEDIPVTEKDGTFNSIIGNGGKFLTDGDDDYERVYLPFEFYYDGELVEYASACTNGYVTFDWSTTRYYGTPGYDYGLYRAVAWAFEDLHAGAGGIYYKLEGSPGSQVLIFEWDHMRWYYPREGDMNAQIRLYEGSNRIEIIYGKMDVGGGDDNTAICFAGNKFDSYSAIWNIDPNEMGSSIIHWSPEDNSSWHGRYFDPEDEAQNLYEGKMYVLGKAEPEIAGVFPGSEGLESPFIMKRGYTYPWNGTHPDRRHPAIIVDRTEEMPEVTITYSIAGPGNPSNPNYQVIYEALDPETGGTDVTPPADGEDFRTQPVNIDEDTPGAYYFESARGTAAASDGSLDLTSSSIAGGSYAVTATIRWPDGDVQEYKDYFQIALERDVALTTIKSPKPADEMKYPFSASRVAVEVNAANVGVFAAKSFGINADIYSEDGTHLYHDSIFYENEEDYLRTGDGIVVDQFDDFRPNSVGNYRISFEIPVDGVTTYDLDADPAQRYTGDQDAANNVLPPLNEEYWFRVAHEIEASADSIINPGEEVFVGRPVRPSAIFSNNGVSDISNAPAVIYITDSNGNEVYRSDIIIQDIPQGRVNESFVKFNDIFIPPAAGIYTACIEVNESNDPVDENNTFCKSFEVVGALDGIYTIGTKNEGNARNFPTIEEALNELYLKGMTGPVEFRLTDAVYEVGDLLSDVPAIDISSKITGLSEDNTLVFRPGPERSDIPGGVHIKMASGTGIGIKIAQETQPVNLNAPVYLVTDQVKKNYANPSGYITFDGGDSKALKVSVESTVPFRAPFYLGNGASNITIKNVIIDGNTDNQSMTCELPMTKYSVSQRAFEYENDWQAGTRSFSSGIVIRNTPPFDEKFETNYYRLDTLRNSNNVIENNEISGFGYGVVTLGIGVLYLDYDQQGNPVGFTKYYNENNIIRDNIISNINRAGLFLGYEKNAKISGNRIYNIEGNCSGETAGILLGGEASPRGSGYNNIGIQVLGNEISGVNASGGTAFGIKAEQFRTSYPSGNMFVYFPDEDENILIANNIVWGLNPAGEADAHRGGIYMTTSRDYHVSDYMSMLLTPLDPDYWTKGGKIANNTVIISDDGNLENTGLTAGLAVQQSENAKIYNNAIMFEDDSFSEMSPVTAAIFYQGVMPGDKSMQSNRNAFSMGSSNAAVYRFVETNDENEIVEYGSRNEFTEISQWRVWTGQDLNSVEADFSSDYAKAGIAPYRYRIDENPLPPKGSVLNNRGMRLDYVEEDIDGNTRGAAGSRYDIGAVEFNGRMYINDIEMTVITAPASYRSGDGLFDDAEYIMTQAPVNVDALIRNNGTLQQSDIDMYIDIFREEPEGGYDMDNPVLSDSLKTSVPSTESSYVMFNLSDDDGPVFNPQPYSELSGYQVPEKFSTMTPNVTPKYKVRVRVESDEHNENNALEKELRFYLMRSPIRLIVSTENSTRDLDLVVPNPPSIDEVAGKLNMDSLLAGMRGLGWFTDERVDRYDIDLFDRGSWEPRSVDYTMYRSLFWSDGDDSDMGGTMTRYQRMDVEDYLKSGDNDEKKNIVVGSEEIVRNQTDSDNPNFDAEFISRTLRAVNVAPGNPLGAGVSNDGNSVTGVAVGRELEEDIRATGFSVAYTDDNGSHTMTDVQPYTALVNISSEGPGFARPAYFYNNYTGSDSTMGIATTSQSANVVFLGVDWRHWGNIERVLRSVLDFIEKNGGVVIPVELTDFNAKAVGKSAQLDWETASEYNSARFEIERSRINEAGQSEYQRVGEVAAAGESATGRDYNYRDFGVDYGRSYSYRLKMVDADGSYDYSSARIVTIGETDATLTVSEAMPNPATDEARFAITASNEMSLDGKLYDMSGQMIGNVISTIVNGTQTVTLDLQNLSSGSYQLVLKSGDVLITRTITVVK